MSLLLRQSAASRSTPVSAKAKRATDTAGPECDFF
jgi:hypothetical protein